MFAVFALLAAGCGGWPVFTPNPPEKSSEKPQKQTRAPAVESKKGSVSDTSSPSAIESDDEIDFALAFVDTLPESGDKNASRVSPRKPSSISVPGKMVRVLLKKNIKKTQVYFPAEIVVRHSGLKKPYACRGRIGISVSEDAVLFDLGAMRRYKADLPCSLMSSGAGYFELEDSSYRGSVILASSTNKTINVINYLPVEDYLRGVVPLEIGPRPDAEREAVKAQAVAARTYTYKRMIDRQKQAYDLVTTVADQVYGGVQAENSGSDRAIGATRNIVMAYGDSLINAFYHSTCGGRTANIEDVWDRPAQPYLRSVIDADTLGVAYCSISRYFTWEQSWPSSRLAAILAKYGPKAFPKQKVFSGAIRSIDIKDRRRCGRVATCEVATTRGVFAYGGDKIRFAFRRNEANYPIMRSASLLSVKVANGMVLVSGSGYGHGVGMCQMGAIGRARAGQTYSEILRAYYRGSHLAQAVVMDEP